MKLLFSFAFLVILHASYILPIMVIGHRGACGYTPENTLASFAKALEMHVDIIELDVFLCASGQVVVIHDAKIDRTTNSKGKVSQLTLEELQSVDAGNGEIIPTLRQVFDLVNRRAIIDIELKGTGTAQAVAQLIEEYVSNYGWCYQDFIVTSFNHYLLKEFNELCPKVVRGAIINAIPLAYAQFGSDLAAQAIIVCKDFISKEYVKDAHTRGLKVLVYTVNEPDEINEMKELGVDGIISNFPDRV